MSRSKELLHGNALLTAVTETALAMQRATSLSELIATMGAGLERLGLHVALLSLDHSGYGMRYLTDAPGVRAVLRAFNQGDESMRWPRLADTVVGSSEEPLLVQHIGLALQEYARALGHALPDEAIAALPTAAIVTPLHVREENWGGLVVLHDDLREEDVGVVRLFALALGTALEVRDGFTRLERRTAELELAHELAVAGPRADSRVLCHRALETICRTTQSDSAILHRYDVVSGEYVIVGDPYGYDGALVDRYRRFSMPDENPVYSMPLAVRVSELPLDAAFATSEGFVHMAIVPLAIEGKRVGMLTLGRTRDVSYGEVELRSAEILGVQMASLLERARLYDEASRLYGDLKKSYDELAHAQQELVRHERLAALGELAAVMAHEVRNPLGVIFNSLTTLKRLLRPTGDSEMLLNMVGEEADRLNRIVGDLLDFVRPYELTKKPVAVEPVIANAVDAAAQSTLNSNVRVLTEFPRELPPFPLDAHLLKQALVNLIVNAAQAMPKGGVVTVVATIEPQAGMPWLCVRVRDEGVGLTQRATEKMFQPFFTTKATGTGLGLAVVKRIVDSHMGEVIARANDDGKGTTFTMRIPSTHETRSTTLTPPRPSAAVPRR